MRDLNAAPPVTVLAYPQGRPRVLRGALPGSAEQRVVRVTRTWTLVDEWWRRPVERDYFEVVTDGGWLCHLYRDAQDGRWYLQQVWD
jgi:hypothetical protein